jgi:endonuclease/exonuclease/phosphatase (EEP) superfamily protein YafD
MSGRSRPIWNMPTLLFWNLNRRSLDRQVGLLARQHKADIVILAEAGTAVEDTLDGLNTEATSLFSQDPGHSDRLRILSRFPRQSVTPISDRSRVSIRQYAPPIGAAFLVVAVHLPSKLHQDQNDQYLACAHLAKDIQRAEQQGHHSRTIVIGDFNMNPFEPGVVAAGGLHAIMDRRVASKLKRTVKEREYEFFYNPMWARLGDLRGRPGGTFFRDSGDTVSFYWNMFDQVLLRPALLDAFDDDGIHVVTEIAGESLLDRSGKPRERDGSDHLPIVVQLHEIEEVLS